MFSFLLTGFFCGKLLNPEPIKQTALTLQSLFFFYYENVLFFIHVYSTHSDIIITYSQLIIHHGWIIPLRDPSLCAAQAQHAEKAPGTPRREQYSADSESHVL